MDWRSGSLVIVLLLGNLWGCAHHLVPPPAPGAGRPVGDLSHVDLALGDVRVEGEASIDNQADARRVARSLMRYLDNAVRFRGLGLAEDRRRPTLPTLRLDLDLKLDRTRGATVILDALNVLPPLWGVFTPAWGDVRAKIVVRLSAPDGRRLAVYERSVTSTYYSIFYSWYRTGPIEDAFADLFEAAFVSIGAELQRDAPFLAAALVNPADLEALAGATVPPQLPVVAAAAAADGDAGQQPIDRSPSPSATTAPSAATAERPEWLGQWVKPRYFIPPDDVMRVKHKVQTPPFTLTPIGLLRLLGGVEGAAFIGLARVSSGFEDELGQEIEVGAGQATQKGYRVSLYTPPRRTGWFWYPSLGFVGQEISIADFRGSFYTLQNNDPANIEPTCSDPDTGAALDCGAPNTYLLNMMSGYLGGRVGYQVLYGNAWVELFLSATGGLNLLEYRSLRTRVGDYDQTATGFDFLRSGALGLVTGLMFPKLHFGARVAYDYELYRNFAYADKVPMKGPSEYDPDTDRWERPLRFVDDVGLQAWNIQGTIFVVF